MELIYYCNRKREMEPVLFEYLPWPTVLGILFVPSFNPHKNQEILNLSLISMDKKT